VLSPVRLLVSNDQSVTIGAFDIGLGDFGYCAPELTRLADNVPSESVTTTTEMQSSGAVATGSVARRPDAMTMLAALAPRADVFALGCILWELLAGRPLFKGESDYETLQLAKSATVRCLPQAPPELDAIVRKALAIDVANRYQTARQFGDALADYLVEGARN